MKTEDFNYDLPPERIAQEPATPRDACRLMVLHKDTGKTEHRVFRDIVDYIEPGDLLVANKTRVLPARLRGTKPTGAQAEVLLLSRREDLDAEGAVWEALVHPGRRLKTGATIEFYVNNDLALIATIEGFLDNSKGARLVRFSIPQDKKENYPTLNDAIHAIGAVPLPPYIPNYTGDTSLYQTVYAMNDEHSAAAPTAGLHFTPELLAKIEAKGARVVFVELEVGIDTFRIVEEDDPTEHTMHTERYHVPQEVVDAVAQTKAAGKRVIAVGTTSVRSLESAWDEGRGELAEKENATTNLFLLPGSPFHVVDAMITNFHVPRSTLMMLVSAFAGQANIMNAYKEAIAKEYRMLSFGDAMFIA